MTTPSRLHYIIVLDLMDLIAQAFSTIMSYVSNTHVLILSVKKCLNI